MSATTEMILAQNRTGRVILHLSALFHDGHWQWHVAGIVRELAPWRS